MRTTEGARRLCIVAGMAWAVTMLTAPSFAADPRGEMRLTWTAPGLPGQQASQYDVRISTSPLTADTTGWWNAATPATGEPYPAQAGTVQSMAFTDLEPGTSVYAAIRAQYPTGEWSSITAVNPVTLPGGAFLQGVSPVTIDTDGNRVFTLTGYGLDRVTEVWFQNEGGGSLSGGPLTLINATRLQVTADVSSLGDGTIAVQAVTVPGESVLEGWVEVNAAGGVIILPDTVAPQSVTNLHATGVTETAARLTWTAPADPSPTGTRRAASYEIRRLEGAPGSWSWGAGTIIAGPAPAVPGTLESMLVGGLTSGTIEGFALVAVDSAGNVSGVSNTATVNLVPTVEIIEPEAVADLAAAPADPGAVLLTWTAPAVETPEGSQPVALYELRRMGGEPGNWSWTTGEVVPTDPPAAPGEPESLTVSGLTPGSVQAFSIISSDGAGEWSRSSNLAEVVLPLGPDVTPPAAVSDLEAALAEDSGVQLSWTAPEDDRGAVLNYVVHRWDGSPETFDWETAVNLADPPAPGNPGQAQHWFVGTVSGGQCAVFAICGLDPAGNPSALSNLAVVDRRGDDLISPADPMELLATRFGTAGVQIRWKAPGDDVNEGRAESYELRHAVSPVDEGWMESAEEVPLGRAPKQPGKVEFVNLRNLQTGVVHLFALRAVDEAGNMSGWVVGMVHVDDPGAVGTDAAPPPAPDSLTALRGAGGVQLQWTGVGVANLVGYRLYRAAEDGLSCCVADIISPTTNYMDMAPPSGELRYTICSVDGEGNVSRMGTTVLVETGPTLPDLGLTRAGGSWRLRVEEPTAPEAGDRGLEPLVQVFDVQGRLVSEIPLVASAGGWEASWSGRSLSGAALPRGVFFLRAIRGEWHATRKIILR